jgi:hypothetical protein
VDVALGADRESLRRWRPPIANNIKVKFTCCTARAAAVECEIECDLCSVSNLFNFVLCGHSHSAIGVALLSASQSLTHTRLRGFQFDNLKASDFLE